jgi:hypothetical protein
MAKFVNLTKQKALKFFTDEYKKKREIDIRKGNIYVTKEVFENSESFIQEKKMTPFLCLRRAIQEDDKSCLIAILNSEKDNDRLWFRDVERIGNDEYHSLECKRLLEKHTKGVYPVKPFTTKERKKIEIEEKFLKIMYDSDSEDGEDCEDDKNECDKDSQTSKNKINAKEIPINHAKLKEIRAVNEERERKLMEEAERVEMENEDNGKSNQDQKENMQMEINVMDNGNEKINKKRKRDVEDEKNEEKEFRFIKKSRAD